jgi:hypothetical protein
MYPVQVVPLPPQPNLAQYKKLAKDLVKQCKSGSPDAIRLWAVGWLESIAQLHTAEITPERREQLDAAAAEFDAFATPLLRSAGPDSPCALTKAQFAIARTHGFDSWAKLVRHIEGHDEENVPAEVWKSAEAAVIQGDDVTLDKLLNDFPAITHRYAPAYTPSGPGPDYSRANARAIIIREQQFNTWEDFAAHKAEWGHSGSEVAQFEEAAEAIIDGDAVKLERLLRANPTLIHMRSKRFHHSALIHYVGANGFEGYRQKTPSNAVQIATMLLDAGAEINAEADLYGGSQTLGLIATSIHPQQADVQADLIELFLERGASIDGGFEDENSCGYNYGAVNGCLANGRGDAAALLAERGARLDLEGAAGVGRLDVVMSYFDERGELMSSATRDQMQIGFGWACEYGRHEVIEYLLDHGVEVGGLGRGMTGLHWATLAGRLDTVRLLLHHGAPLEVLNDYGGTVLGGTVWAAYNCRQPDHLAIIDLLIERGAVVGEERQKWIDELRSQEASSV